MFSRQGKVASQDAVRGLSWQQVAEMSVTVLCTDQRAVVHDHGQRRGNLFRDGQREIIASPSDESDFNAAFGGFPDGRAIRRRDFPIAAEQGSIDIERDQSDSHTTSLAEKVCEPVTGG